VRFRDVLAHRWKPKRDFYTRLHRGETVVACAPCEKRRGVAVTSFAIIFDGESRWAKCLRCKRRERLK